MQLYEVLTFTMYMIMNYSILFFLIILSTLIRLMLCTPSSVSKKLVTNKIFSRLLISVDFVFAFTIIVKPKKLETALLDLLLMGLSFFLASMIKGVWKYIRKLESEVKTKTKEVIDCAEAYIIRLWKQSEELFHEQNRLLEENQTSKNMLQELESELETKTTDVTAAQVHTIVVTKKFEEFHLEYGCLLEEKESLKNQFELLGTRIKQLEYELETKTKDFSAAEEAYDISLREHCVELLLEFDRLFGQNLKNQLEESDTRIEKIESELERTTKMASAAEANNIALRNQHDRLIEINDHLNNELQLRVIRLRQVESEIERKKKEVSVAEANSAALMKENQNLKMQLESSGTRLKQREPQLGTKTNNVNAAQKEANNSPLSQRFRNLLFDISPF